MAAAVLTLGEQPKVTERPARWWRRATWTLEWGTGSRLVLNYRPTVNQREHRAVVPESVVVQGPLSAEGALFVMALHEKRRGRVPEVHQFAREDDRAQRVLRFTWTWWEVRV